MIEICQSQLRREREKLCLREVAARLELKKEVAAREEVESREKVTPQIFHFFILL
jgi:hypothetical protein